MSPPDYSAILDLTVHMQRAANAQDWDELIRIEAERRSALAATTSQTAIPRAAAVSAQEARAAIADIERIDREIIEQVEAWRDDVAVLLGMRKG